MCRTCGCSPSEIGERGADAAREGAPGHTHALDLEHEDAHEHELELDHQHEHDHEHVASDARRTEAPLPVPILEAVDREAAVIRARLAEHDILCLNVVGTPGAGKTTLVGVTIKALRERGLRCGAVVADLATENDARKLREAAPGAMVEAVETGTTCHLTPGLLSRALDRLPLADLDVLFVENVGNLVCPALFDLGERAKVCLVSVTEGTDKPQKYPVMVQHSALFCVTKLDLLPYVDFDLGEARGHAERIHPGIRSMALSATSGEGLEEWLTWIETRCPRPVAGTPKRR